VNFSKIKKEDGLLKAIIK